MEAFEAGERSTKALLKNEDDLLKNEQAADRAKVEAAEAEETRLAEEHAEQQRLRQEAWEAEFYDQEEEREPTEEEAAETIQRIPQAVEAWGIEIEVFAECRFPEDVSNIVSMKKQFNEIDFDQSGQIDKHEMKVALGKLGMDLSEEQIATLLSEGDESSDAELDFGEFVAFVARFKSSKEEKNHQAMGRKASVGLGDAMQNMNLVRVETEFGSEMVVQRKEVAAWEAFMEFPDPLHWACGKGDLVAVKQFILGTEGAPKIRADYINKDGKMPVHYAAVWDQVMVLEYLLDRVPHGAGAKPDPSDPNWMTPLFAACQRGCTKTVGVLIDRWANINQRDLSGTTPLVQAVTQNHLDVVDKLLSAGAIVSASDDQSIRLWTLGEGQGRIPTGGGQGPVKVLESDRQVNKQTGAMGSVYCMHLLQDRMVTGHYDGSVRLSPVSTQQGPHPFDINGLSGTRIFKGHDNAVLCVKMEDTGSTVEGKWMMTAGEDATARLFDIASGACVRVYRDTREGTNAAAINGVDFSSRGDRVVGGTRFGILLVWRFSDATTLATLSVHPASSITAVQLRGDWVLTASYDRAIKLSSLLPKTRAHAYIGHESAVQCVTRIDGDVTTHVPVWGEELSERDASAWPDSIVSGSATGEILIWTLLTTPGSTEVPRVVLRGENGQATAHTGGVWDLCVFFHGTTRLLAASSTPDSGIAVWNLSEPGLNLLPEGFAPGAVIGRSSSSVSDEVSTKGIKPRSSSAPIRRFLGHGDDVRCVSWYGVDVNLTDPTGNTPLMVACDRGHTDIARRLLATHGIDVWAGDKRQNETALHMAAKNGHVACVTLLLEFDPSLILAVAGNQISVLHSAVEHEINSPNVVKACVAARADVNFRDAKGETALHRAAKLGHWRALDILAYHPDVDRVSVGAPFPIGGEPLMRPRAAPKEHRHPSLVKAPVQFTLTRERWVKGTSAEDRVGVDCSSVLRREHVTEEVRTVRHTHGWTALHQAAAYGRSAATKILLDAGWNPNALDDLNRRALHLACANGTPDFVKLLVECGAEVNARDKMGSTALHYAVKTSQEEAARMLIQSAEAQGTLVDLEAQEDMYDLRPLQMSARYGLEEMTFLLLDSGANINAADQRLATPLHYAAYGAVGEHLEKTAPEVSTAVARGAFDEHARQRAAGWVAQWREGKASTKGFGARRLDELRREVLLDAFARYDARDARGRTAKEIVQADPGVWERLDEAFSNTEEDGRTFVMFGDVVSAQYLGDRGTRFEHPNKWTLVTTFGVRCAAGKPTLSGSRAFKKPMSRYAAQEVDYRSLGDFDTGQAGTLDRTGCTLYILSMEYTEDFSGLAKEARSLLCKWDPTDRTFETKFNTMHVELVADQVYTLKVVQAQDPPAAALVSRGSHRNIAVSFAKT
ncbi:ankyrin repeat-containing domain protein [Baffinella frigidus]|nr:ankyrin repeat-containing domain protein [Cryptophyta sp. CCMP2293]